MSFKKDKHIRYWRMCANILPDAYTSSDASRMFLGFFIVAALDLLDVLNVHHNTKDKKPVVSAEDQTGWIDWIYGRQVPDGEGFRGFTGTDLGSRRNDGNRCWDPENLPNTFFALSSLLVLGDDLARVQRDKCLQWLPRLQRPDGSFGEIIGPDGQIEGGRDLRYCCCAAGIAYIFHDPLAASYKPAFDEDRLIDYILSCQNYNGGYGESPLREPHSGLNYCANATLELISRLNGPSSDRANQALKDSGRCIRWSLDRQTSVLCDEEQVENEEDEDEDDGSHVDGDLSSLTKSSTSCSADDEIVGFNGRDNKIADTCYCFWNSGTLAILDSLHMANIPAVRRYLLDKVQHMIGGFAKDLDSPPDVMHSYLGLAALALFGEPDVKQLDPALCISKSAAANLQYVAWRQRPSAS